MTSSETIKLGIAMRKRLNQANLIQNVNKGGCASVAYALAEYVNTVAPKKKAQIIFLFEDCNTYGIDKANNNQFTSCAHAVVKIGKFYYDSEGKYTFAQLCELCTPNDSIIAVVMSPILTLKCIKYGGWNRKFCRKTGIPQINTIFNIKISA